MKTNDFLVSRLSKWFLLFFLFVIGLPALNVQALQVKTRSVDRIGTWPDVVATATNVIGDYAEVAFDGSGIIWEAVTWDNAGMVEISLDGEVVDKLDLFGVIWGRITWEKTGLPLGYHVLRITLIEEKNPESSDHWINLFGKFIVVDPLVVEEGSGWTSKADGWGGLGLPSNCVVGDYVEVPFQGTGIVYNYLQFQNGVMLQASIDGEEVGMIDLYSEIDANPNSWKKEGLKDSIHSLRLTITDQHNPAAIEVESNPGYFCNYLGFETISTTITESGIDWDIDPTNNSFITSVPTATVDVTFEGTNIRWLSKGNIDSGIATVSIDGATPETVNQQREGINVPIVWEKTDLKRGTHTLRIGVSPDSPKDAYINYVQFQQVGRAAYLSATSEQRVEASSFVISQGQLLIRDERYKGTELQVYVSSINGKMMFCENIRVENGETSIQLPEFIEPSIVVVMDKNTKVYAQKVWPN